MNALLLSAGLGTRLRPITESVPKCLVPIHGKPLMTYWLDRLLCHGIEHVVINTHYLSEVVNAYVDASRWKDSINLVHETELLGTGGTVLRNKEYFQDAPFLVAHADNLTRFDMEAFIQSHLSRRGRIEITMMTFDTDCPTSCGIVEQDPDGIVIGFHEKVANPPGTRANAAVYIFEPSVISFIQSLNKDVVDISTEVLPQFLGRIGTFHNADYHRDIGTLESLRLAEIEFPKL